MKLAQKYRPKKFSDVLGQDNVVEILRAVVKQGVFGSAYMLSGPRGVGKTTTGRIFAKAILCEGSIDGEPCGKCSSCLSFENETHYGYIELDAASSGGKENMVRLRDEAEYQSVTKYKIILLDECHDITGQGQDALLNQLEKCPKHLIYIFCTTEPDQMKPTVRDRCMHLPVFKVPSNLITNRLKFICEQEKLSYEEKALQVLVDGSGGHVRNAISSLEEIAYLGSINLANVNRVIRNFDNEIFEILANLGKDLKKVVDIYRRVSGYLSVLDFYNQILSMISDASKLLYGYENFPEERKVILNKLKDIHGFSLLEFLNYFISRDRYIDKMGVEGDLIIMHYKFCANNFVPPTVVQQKETVIKPQTVTPQKQNSAPSYADFQKMDLATKSRILREQRKTQNIEQTEAEIVPVNWPLPKEERKKIAGDEDILSPQEFSMNLLGGRSCGVRSMVDP